MPRLYAYVGPEEIRRRCAGAAGGRVIAAAADLLDWLRGNDPDGPATFVIDAEGRLRLAPRRSEHVACAGGGPVRSAGEMFFEGAELVEVSNQSTGFCPEPESWPEVAAALDRTGIPHPGRFTTEVIFRRCPACGQRNVVKDGWFICTMCQAELPANWNLDIVNDNAR